MTRFDRGWDSSSIIRRKDRAMVIRTRCVRPISAQRSAVSALVLLIPAFAAAAEPIGFDEVARYCVDHTPRSGSFVASYRSKNAEAGLIVGYDIETGSWFKISHSAVSLLAPDGSRFRGELDAARLERIGEARVPPYSPVDDQFPQVLLIELAHRPDAFREAHRTPDGGVAMTFAFPYGNRDIVLDQWNPDFEPEMFAVRVTTDGDGVVREVWRERGNRTETVGAAEGSPAGFPIAESVRPPDGWGLVSIEHNPAGRADWFTHDAVVARAKESDTRLKPMFAAPKDPDSPFAAVHGALVQAGSRRDAPISVPIEPVRADGSAVRAPRSTLHWWIISGGGALVALALAYRLLPRR